VTGRVQGVFYRASTVKEAARLGLTGWVRNEPDGSVVLEAQGSREAVEALVAWARKGPSGARVVAVDAEAVPEVAGEASFRVR
jgi:acylphosphatase